MGTVHRAGDRGGVPVPVGIADGRNAEKPAEVRRRHLGLCQTGGCLPDIQFRVQAVPVRRLAIG